MGYFIIFAFAPGTDVHPARFGDAPAAPRRENAAVFFAALS